MSSRTQLREIKELGVQQIAIERAVVTHYIGTHYTGSTSSLVSLP